MEVVLGLFIGSTYADLTSADALGRSGGDSGLDPYAAHDVTLTSTRHTGQTTLFSRRPALHAEKGYDDRAWFPLALARGTAALVPN